MKRISIMRCPYPYKGMIAFSSDIDGSNYKRYTTYKKLFESYNIPFSDTFWFYNSACDSDSIESETISYFKCLTNKKNYNELILNGIQLGNFDALHSYGNWSGEYNNFKREFARKALDELNSINEFTQKNIQIWISHGDINNTQNFGQEGRLGKKFQKGDIKFSDEYHTDLLSNSSIRYVWSRDQSQIKNFLLFLKKILRRLYFTYENRNFFIKLLSLIRELLLDLSQGRSYGNKSLIFPIKLRDGSLFWGFERYTDNWHLDKIHEQISKKNINFLLKNHYLIIIANHFGYPSEDNGILITKEVHSSLKYIQGLQKSQSLLIVKQIELLNYNLVRDYMKYHYLPKLNMLILEYIGDPVFGNREINLDDLKGISFRGLPQNVIIKLNNLDITEKFIYNANLMYFPWS